MTREMKALAGIDPWCWEWWGQDPPRSYYVPEAGEALMTVGGGSSPLMEALLRCRIRVHFGRTSQLAVAIVLKTIRS